MSLRPPPGAALIAQAANRLPSRCPPRSPRRRRPGWDDERDRRHPAAAALAATHLSMVSASAAAYVGGGMTNTPSASVETIGQFTTQKNTGWTVGWPSAASMFGFAMIASKSVWRVGATFHVAR